MKIALLYIIVILATVNQIRCSSDIAGGNGSETTNGIIIAIANQDGSPAKNTAAILVPENYNPVADSALPSYLHDTTDSQGICTFYIPESVTVIYNIQALHQTRRTRGFGAHLKASSDTGITYSLELGKPGYIELLIPDTVNNFDGYLFFEGTLFTTELFNNTIQIGGYYSIFIDSIPPVVLPSLIYGEHKNLNKKKTLAPSLPIAPMDTLSIAISENSIKPVWRFSFVIAVHDNICNYYGGLEKVKPYITQQFNEITEKFNKPSVFDGVFHFSADSAYRTNLKMNDITADTLPLQNHDFRLIYYYNNIQSEKPSLKNRGKIMRFESIYLWDTPKEVFEKKYTDVLIALFGECRGALHLEMFHVDSTKNPINGRSFIGINSFMNISYKPNQFRSFQREWDLYSIGVINHNRTTLGTERDIVFTAFPQSMGIVVKSKKGSVVPNADIRVYGSKLDSKAVMKKPIYQGTTNGNGTYMFDQNPFQPDPGKTFEYGNLLITAQSEEDTAYTWFPLFDAGKGYFNNPNKTLLLEVQF